MLDGLDDIDWASLKHAHGSAADMPGVLRKVAAGKPYACNPLFETICHQGSVYEATRYAVPFIVELLSVKRAQEAMCDLLISITKGATTYNTRSPDVVLVLEAVRAHIPTYEKWLAEGNPSCRRRIATLLGTLKHWEPLHARINKERTALGPVDLPSGKPNKMAEFVGI